MSAVESPTTTLERVWEPLTVGNVVIPNRLMMTPHGMHYGTGVGGPSERLLAYYDERAQGGSGLLGVNGTLAHRRSLGGGLPSGMDGFAEENVPAFARLAETVHRHGARVFVELVSPGVADATRFVHDEWRPVYGLSRVPGPTAGSIPAVMDHEFIRTMVADFAVTAGNMQQAGIDGIELHGAHGYLLMQALSPAFNKRTDKYGGTPRKRCQLIIEVASAIRERVGSDYPVGLRYSFDEFIGDAGITPELSEEYLDILAETGLFSHFDVSGGGTHGFQNVVMPMGGRPEGYMIPYGQRAKEIVGDRAKIFVVGRIRTVEMAEQVLRDGASDMVALLRAQIADPQIVRKAREGRAHETRRCIGANECISAAEQLRPVACTVNPMVGRERQWPSTLDRAAEARRITVIGAGPAGLRFAATAAERGHDITVVDGSEAVGGHLSILRRMPTRGDWGFLVDDLEAASARAGVRFRLGTRVTAESVAALEADVLVLATGSRYDTTGFTIGRPGVEQVPGTAGNERVRDLDGAALSALADPTSLGRRVVIFDEEGAYLPLGLAELLASNGVQVAVATRHLTVGRQLLGTYEAGMVFPRLLRAGVEFRAQVLPERIDGTTVRVASIWGSPEPEWTDVDTVVMSMLRSPVDDLVAAAQAGGFERVLRIGDVVAPRVPSEVIFEAEKAARSV